jgi:hypothetical protein
MCCSFRYFYESIVLISKVALWGSLVMFNKDSQFQLAFGTLICLIQGALQLRLLPYSTKDKNAIQSVGMLISSFLAIGGILINHLNASIRIAELTNEQYELADLRANVKTTKDIVAMISIGGLVITTAIQVGKYALSAYEKRGGTTAKLVKKFSSRKKKGTKSRVRRSSLGSAVSCLSDGAANRKLAATAPQENVSGLENGVEMPELSSGAADTSRTTIIENPISETKNRDEQTIIVHDDTESKTGDVAL